MICKREHPENEPCPLSTPVKGIPGAPEEASGPPGRAAPGVGAPKGSPVTPHEPTADDDPLIGTTIGSFLVTRRLGLGGMGTVYLGEQAAIGSKVAIKVLHEHLASNPSLVQRFYAEARATNLIGHEHIVSIIDLSVLPPNRYYFIMEYLEGKALNELPRPMAAKDVVHIVTQACEALQAAHAHGVVHRDLKPENMILIRRGRNEQFLKILDFGIAKLFATELAGQKTVAGMIMGTPEFMAPEQTTGHAVDGRTDLYALGIIAYELATGQLPFSGNNLADLLVAQRVQAAVPPHVLNPSIPVALSVAILRAMEKAPEARWQTADEFREALDASLSSLTRAPPTGPGPDQASAPSAASDAPQGPARSGLEARPVQAKAPPSPRPDQQATAHEHPWQRGGLAPGPPEADASPSSAPELRTWLEPFPAGQPQPRPRPQPPHASASEPQPAPGEPPWTGAPPGPDLDADALSADASHPGGPDSQPLPEPSGESSYAALNPGPRRAYLGSAPTPARAFMGFGPSTAASVGVASRPSSDGRVTNTWSTKVFDQPQGGSRQLKGTELTRGGMFLLSEGGFPPLFTRVKLSIGLHDGELTLWAEVVRHVTAEQAAAWKMPLGFGVQFVDLTQAQRDALADLTSGRPLGSSGLHRPQERDDARAEEALARFRQRNAASHYEFLGVFDDADFAEVRQKVRDAKKALADLRARPLSVRQRDQLESFDKRLDEVLLTIGQPRHRLDYDAQRGNWKGAAKCIAGGVSVTDLDNARRRYLASKDRVEGAAHLHFTTGAAWESQKDLLRAQQEFERALALDPLNLAFHQRYQALRRTMSATPSPAKKR